jgi:hypothetical protein
MRIAQADSGLEPPSLGLPDRRDRPNALAQAFFSCLAVQQKYIGAQIRLRVGGCGFNPQSEI